jgi:hypothetical protein
MTPPVDPLPDEVVDELLSADLDGDFDLAARDHGLAPATARARIEATPRTAERRAALAAARDAIAVGPLSDDERVSLLAGARVARGDDALEPRRARRAQRRTATIAAAAAAIALVIALGASLASLRDGDGGGGRAASKRSASESVARDGAAPESATPSDGSGTSAADPAAPTAAGATPVYDFGAAANREELRAKTEALVPQFALRALGDAGSDAQRSGELAPSSPGSAPGSSAQQFSSTACLERRGAAVRAGGPLIARGPVTYAGAPAEALVFAEDDHFRVLVVDDTGGRCRLLADEVVNPEP